MPRTLIPCIACASLVYEGTCHCPHCGAAHPCVGRRAGRIAALVAAGLTLAGCHFDRSQSEYSSAPTDDDDDGYTRDDCDDADADIHPDARERAGDGVDSNCNGEDDT